MSAPSPAPATTGPPSSAADPHRFVAGLAAQGLSLELKTIDLCFVAALYLRADRASLASFDDDELVDTFEQICDLVEPTAENPRKRATHAIQRLREQRMLHRVDGGGMARPGDYTLTHLAAAIVQYFLADEALTRETLLVLTRTLHASLNEIRTRARAADAGAWRADVIAPLGVVVAELVGSIERRQSGLDAQQEEVQRRLGELLQDDWFGAMDACQALLDTTTATLQELNQVLMRDAHLFVTTLQEIQELAGEAGLPEGEEAAQRVIEHVDRIAEWGTSRQRAWSEYYQYVHRFLQDVVRLDPDRALSERLRDQIAAWDGRHALVAAAAPSIRLLRPVEGRVLRPPVLRAREDREAALDLVETRDEMALLDAAIARAVAAGARSLAEITRAVTEEAPPEERFLLAGRVAGRVGRDARVRSALERPWVGVGALVLEDWEPS